VDCPLLLAPPGAPGWGEARQKTCRPSEFPTQTHTASCFFTAALCLLEKQGLLVDSLICCELIPLREAEVKKFTTKFIESTP